jgi:hypothetical protein
MKSHTPGPWKIFSEDDETVEFIHTIEFRRDSVMTEEEKAANESLITAAPEMFEALDFALYHKDLWSKDKNKVKKEEEFFRKNVVAEMIRLFETALNKAKNAKP